MKNFNQFETYQQIKKNELSLYDFDQEHCVIRPCLSITLFFKHGGRAYVRENLLELLNAYLAEFGQFIIAGKFSPNKYAKKNEKGINKIKDHLINNPRNLQTYCEVSSGKTAYDASEYNFSMFLNGEFTEDFHENNGQLYLAEHDAGTLSSLKMHFPIDFLNDNAKFDVFKQFLNQACHRLPIRGGYAGISLSLPSDRHAYLPQEYQIAKNFSGLDMNSYWFVEDTKYVVLSTRGEEPKLEFFPYEYRENDGGKVEFQGFIKSTNWINIFPKIFFDRVGGYDKAIQQLQRKDIKITDLDDCVMIQAGENPQLGSKEQGLPEAYVFVNKVLKYLRDPESDTLQPDLGDIDTADENNTKVWLNRFDINENEKNGVDPQQSLRLYPDEICPKTGWWDAPNLLGRKQFIQQGEKATGPHQTEGGNLVIWYWRDINNQ